MLKDLILMNGPALIALAAALFAYVLGIYWLWGILIITAVLYEGVMVLAWLKWLEKREVSR
jgi:hypothetical protein